MICFLFCDINSGFKFQILIFKESDFLLELNIVFVEVFFIVGDLLGHDSTKGDELVIFSNMRMGNSIFPMRSLILVLAFHQLLLFRLILRSIALLFSLVQVALMHFHP